MPAIMSLAHELVTRQETTLNQRDDPKGAPMLLIGSLSVLGVILLIGTIGGTWNFVQRRRKAKAAARAKDPANAREAWGQ